MWGGKVKVVEAGSAIVDAAGILNFFLAIHYSILVGGTEVSSWSTLSINSRYYRDIKENYFYRPEWLYCVTPPRVRTPHWFRC